MPNLGDVALINLTALQRTTRLAIELIQGHFSVVMAHD